MKKLIAIILLFALLLSGCGEAETSGGYTEEETSDRFEMVYEQMDWTYEYCILEDTETGVMYLCVVGDEEAGLTVMVDASGDPLIWRD